MRVKVWSKRRVLRGCALRKGTLCCSQPLQRAQADVHVGITSVQAHKKRPLI